MELTPCIIVSRKQAEEYALCGTEIQPDRIVIPYITEHRAKNDAHQLSAQYARIDYHKLIFG
jgi:hypothetical protein